MANMGKRRSTLVRDPGFYAAPPWPGFLFVIRSCEIRLRFFRRGVVSAILSPSPSPKRRFCLRVGIFIPAEFDSAHEIAKHLLAVARRSMYLPRTAGEQFMAVQCCNRWFFGALEFPRNSACKNYSDSCIVFNAYLTIVLSFLWFLTFLFSQADHEYGVSLNV